MYRIPRSGETIEIHSFKHNGHIHRVWKETTVLKCTSQIFIGANDQTEVIEATAEAGQHVSRPSVIFIPNTGLILSACCAMTEFIITVT